jgi:predicted DNA-binding transcriptional regulator YafY
VISVSVERDPGAVPVSGPARGVHRKPDSGRSASGLQIRGPSLHRVSGDVSPTARALRALDVLQSRPGATAEELGERLGVTERAARRYVAILREAGIPVESTRGRYGGYRLGRGTRLPPVLFTEAEALGLVMAVLDGQPAATDVEDLVGSALSKVIRALPEPVGRQAAALREHASAAPDRRAARPDPVTTSALVASVAARRSVVVRYRGESGADWEGEVDPWAVVVRFGRWYLLCRSHRANAIRTYRVDRIREVQQSSRAFTPPDGLDPVAVLEENLGTGWEFPTRVEFQAAAAEVAPWIRPPMGRLEASGSGCVLVGSTSNPAMYAQEWLATLPFRFRVDGGPELRAAVAAVASRFATALLAPSAQQAPPA